MQRALIEGNSELVELLLEYGDRTEKLTAAVYRGEVKNVDHLVENKEDIRL